MYQVAPKHGHGAKGEGIVKRRNAAQNESGGRAGGGEQDHSARGGTRHLRGGNRRKQ